jgi:hypothetical protein
MGPAGLLVELGLCDDAGLVALPHVGEHLFLCGDGALRQAVDIDAFGDAFTDLQALVGRLD